MSQVKTSSAELDELIQVFSLERFGRYMEKANHDKELAVAYYTYNMQLSESLYTVLQTLEIVLRNRIHQEMTKKFGEKWYDSKKIKLAEAEKDKLAKAQDDIRREEKTETSGQIVATLSFGFWTSLLSRRYDDLWQQHLHVIATQTNGKGIKRTKLNGLLQNTRRLRNRIAHHEPIIFISVMKYYHEILQIIEWLSPPAAIWCKQHCRFLSIHPKEEMTV